MQQSPEHLAGVQEGQILAGKYRVERVLGIGGMGVVVAAHHIQLDERVALKFLLPPSLGDADAVARFVREARAAVRIKNEHVARVTDVGTLPNGAPYMVMEYLDGEDLAAWIKQRGPLPIDQAIEFVLQACVAVADAHALGIVHRDLKPANLFCIRRSDGQLSIKVLDFGISKLANTAGGGPSFAMTKTASMMGSPLYMSPEQMRSSKDVDAQTDLWALGVIVFELITGRPPFQADSVMELAIKVNGEPAPSIRSFRPGAPNGLEAIVFKCLEKDRRLRYRNVAELAVALLPFASGRAKGSVERISGIIHSAGLSTSALAVPASSQMDGTRTFEGTLPPVGRTTVGGSARKKTIVGAMVAGAVALVALVVSVIASTQHSAHNASSSVAAPPTSPMVLPATTTAQESPPTPPVDPPKARDEKVVEPPFVATARLAPVAAPKPAVAPRKNAPDASSLGLATPAAPRAALPPATVPPAAAIPVPRTCDPPYYFDARGNRVFKKECM